MFGFRAGNQDGGGYGEVTAEELLLAGYVLRGLPGDTLMKVAPVVDPGEFRQFFFRVAIQIDTLATERVGKQDFGGQARRGRTGLFKKRGPLLQRGLYGQEPRLRHLPPG